MTRGMTHGKIILLRIVDDIVISMLQKILRRLELYQRKNTFDSLEEAYFLID